MEEVTVSENFSISIRSVCLTSGSVFRCVLALTIALQLAAVIYLYWGPGPLGYIYSDRTANGFQGDLLSDNPYYCKVPDNLEEERLNVVRNDLAGWIFSTFPPNYTSSMNPEGGEEWTARTNSRGLRDEEISIEKPEDTYRILVLGDSYTFGWGLDREERYTDVLERRLNETYDKRIQVVNMGRTDAGMRDFYFILRDRGLKYDPDLVVVSFYSADRSSHMDSKRALKELVEEHDVENRSKLFEIDGVMGEYRDRKFKTLRNNLWRKTDLERYGNRIVDLTQENDFNTTFFLFQHRQSLKGEKFARSAKNWGEECGADVLLPPREYYYRHFEDHTLPQDRHFNHRYNRHMADRLYNYLTKNYLETRNLS